MTGDLAFTGINGRIYTPAEGDGVPGVAFGHDWLKNIKAYHATLRHLASWGIAVVAPDTENGFNPSHTGFAADLDTSLQILAGVRLGSGKVTVGPGKLGLVGHGMGAGAAVLTAADSDRVHAVAALFPAVTSPPAEQAARAVQAPGLIVASGKDSLLDYGNPAKVAVNWKGDMVYREIENGSQSGFTEDTFFKLALGLGRTESSAQETIRGLVTGFLLHQLGGERKYSGFSAVHATAKNVLSRSHEELVEEIDDQRSVKFTA